MANTYSQIYIQAVFVVQDRESLIQKEWRDEMEKYMTGIVQNRGNKLIKIGGMPDHVHLFFGMKPNENIADVMKWVKGSSSESINDNKFSPHKFQWQSGYGAFSYAHSQMDAVVKYIENQEEHHKKMTFREEYLAFLKTLMSRMMNGIFFMTFFNMLSLRDNGKRGVVVARRMNSAATNMPSLRDSAINDVRM